MEDELREEVLRSLQVLARIADEYDTSGLDEIRPEWIENGTFGPVIDKTELFSGRGGKQLLTLGDCLKARIVLKKLERS